MDWFTSFLPVIVFSTLPAAAGGLTAFFYGLHRGYYKDRFIRKVTVELIGSTLVGSFISAPFAPSTGNDRRVVFISFLFGLCWSVVVQILRRKVTRVVEVLLGEETKTTTNSDEGGA